MITVEDVTGLVKQAIPDAQVSVTDMTGTGDHLSVMVVSEAFAGMNALNRHRMVQKALAEAMADGRIHALEIRTETPSA